MKRVYLNIYLLSFLLFFHTAIIAQLPVITTSVNKSRILIGEQVDFKVQVTMPASRYRLTWVQVPSDFGPFVLASSDKIDTAYSTGTLTFKQDLQITSFDSGRQVIPSMPFQFATLTGDSSFQMFTDSIAVEVMYSPADSVLPFHDIKPIIAVRKTQLWWFWWAVAAAILLLGLLIFLYLRSRRKKKTETFVSPLTSFEQAMKSINNLKKEELPSKGEFKVFFIRLTDIFKRYISDIDHENKMHLTGLETIREFSRTNPEKEALDNFGSSIRIADAVKFAKYKPTVLQAGECLSQIEIAIKLIHSPKKGEENDL